MSLSSSPRAFEDCYSVMTAALADDLGARIRMVSMDAAIYFRMRCNHARSLDRQKNAETYDKTHPLHGTSEFDRLTIRLEESADGVWVRFERNEIIPGEVQALSTGEVVPMALPTVIPSIPIPSPPAPPTDEELGEAFAEIEVAPPEAPKLPIRRV